MLDNLEKRVQSLRTTLGTLLFKAGDRVNQIGERLGDYLQKAGYRIAGEEVHDVIIEDLMIEDLEPIESVEALDELIELLCSQDISHLVVAALSEDSYVREWLTPGELRGDEYLGPRIGEQIYIFLNEFSRGCPPDSVLVDADRKISAQFMQYMTYEIGFDPQKQAYTELQERLGQELYTLAQRSSYLIRINKNNEVVTFFKDD